MWLTLGIWHRLQVSEFVWTGFQCWIYLAINIRIVVSVQFFDITKSSCQHSHASLNFEGREGVVQYLYKFIKVILVTFSCSFLLAVAKSKSKNLNLWLAIIDHELTYRWTSDPISFFQNTIFEWVVYCQHICHLCYYIFEIIYDLYPILGVRDLSLFSVEYPAITSIMAKGSKFRSTSPLMMAIWSMEEASVSVMILADATRSPKLWTISLCI